MSEIIESVDNQHKIDMSQNVGIGYNDHEYEKAIHVVHFVENIPENEILDPKATGVDKTVKRGTVLHTPEVQDMFSCGLCGRLYTKLLSMLCHKVSHVSEENPMHCELCDNTTSYSQPSPLIEHYRKIHKVFFQNTSQQRQCRSSSRRKPATKSAVTSPAKKLLPKRRSQRRSRSKASVRDKDKDELSASIVETPVPSVATDPHPNAEGSVCANDPGPIVINVPGSCVSVFSDSQQANISELLNDNSEPVTSTTVVQNGGLTELSTECAAVELNMQNVNPNSNGLAVCVSNEGNLIQEEVITHVSIPSEQLISNAQKFIVTVLDAENSQTSSITNLVSNEPATTSHLQPIAPNITKTIVTKNEKSENIQSDNEADFYFLLATNMVRGSSFVYGKQAFKCLHCDYKSFWKSAFIKHMKDKHVEVLSQNESIEMRSTEINSDQKLMKMSEFITQYQSPTKPHEKRICPKRQADKQGNFPCSSCDKIFPRWSNLRKHMRIHVPTKNFLCVECGKAFKTKSSLCQHHKTHKREDFTCSVCGFQSQISAAIQAHRQLHKQGSYLCDTCGNAYMDKSTLNKHKRVHDPNRPYGCPWPDCTWRFKSEVMCNGHYRTHTTDAQFRCTYCGYAFRHKHHLRRHERQTHGIHHEKTRGARTKFKQNEEAQAVTNITVLRPTMDENNLAQITTDGQLLIPITADSEGNPALQFEVPNLGAVNVSYQGFLQTSLGKVETGHLYL